MYIESTPEHQVIQYDMRYVDGELFTEKNVQYAALYGRIGDQPRMFEKIVTAFGKDDRCPVGVEVTSVRADSFRAQHRHGAVARPEFRETPFPG